VAEQQLDWKKAKDFLFQVSGDIGAAMFGALNYIGDRLGIFKALADSGSVTSAELAAKTGLNERYLREWLSAMSAATYINYDAATAKYSMTPEHALVLAREESPFFLGGFLEMILPNVSVTRKVMEAFKKGGGVTQSEYSPETWEAMERSSANIYRHSFVRKWLPTLPDVVAKLNAGGSYLDVGCGSGRAAISVAKGFPAAKVFGFDAFKGSVDRAVANAKTENVSDRVRFQVVDCTRLPKSEFDFITTFDVVHDSVDPVGLMRSIREALTPGGTYLMVEVNTSSNLEDNINPMGRMMYSISTLYCMTVSLAHGGAGIGACMGQKKARELAEEAGFTHFSHLPIDDAFSILYELKA
jgi:SAM-dependent methyltransferase